MRNCYYEMATRLQTLESRDLERLSCVNLKKEYRDIPLDTSSEEHLSPDMDGSVRSALKDRNESIGEGFVDVLKRSWVYRRNAAFRLSTFSSDRHSTTWSCLSEISVSEVSNISVLGLVITVEEVNNPHRQSQTWSNDLALPKWPLLRSRFASDSTPVSKQLYFGKSLPPLPLFDDEASSIETLKEPFEGTSINVPNDASSTDSGSSNLDSQMTPNSDDDPSSAGEQDEAAYPCKDCGEVSHPAHFIKSGSEW